MSKLLRFEQKAIKSLLKGIQTLAKAVKVTLGPRGKNVVFEKEFGSPVSTKDGVSVAKEITLKNKFENMGALLIKEAASKTADIAGDGTTTAIILAEAIFSEGVKNITAGGSPIEIKRGIDLAVKEVVSSLNKIARPINTEQEIEQIATISANNDPEIGKIIAKAMQKVGQDGIVSIAEAKGMETELNVVEGMQYDKGYLSPYFITNAEKMSVEMEKPYLLVTDKKISTAGQIVPILEKVLKEGSRPLLIIADEIEAEVLKTLVVNKVKQGLSVCATSAPSFGDKRKELLKDLAILTGSTFICDEAGVSLENIEIADLGSAQKIKISKDETTIIDGVGSMEKIQERKTQIKAQIVNATTDYEKENLEERLAKFVGGVAIIEVGAATEAELKEKKSRVEDALHATRAAIAEGIVPGGGVALLRSISSLDTIKASKQELVGIQIIKKACFEPIITMANNCGKKGDVVAEKVFEKEGSNGYNGLSDQYSDLIKDGVIDPVLVTKNALIHAASISSVLLTATVLITEKPQPKSETQEPAQMNPMAGMGMGGMGMNPMGMGGLGGMGMM